MQISVSGQHIDIGQALPTYVEERFTQVIKKYFDDILSASIHFAKEHNQYKCDIIVNDNSGKQLIVKHQQTSDEIYASFDGALVNLEKQLRKYRSKLKNRHDNTKASTIEATKYIIDSTYHQSDLKIAEQSASIITEKPTVIEILSIDEAIMAMDLNNLPALMFQNSANGRINVVYHRKDGNISWVDSK
ncbi:MAG: ribosome-associated translation inhibitor RaiA [Rickettsiaceae bacterium]|nr:MAG: ribosome-associated translation inhibitor RaiA [Rickettsiaceae bacterium]